MSFTLETRARRRVGDGRSRIFSWTVQVVASVTVIGSVAIAASSVLAPSTSQFNRLFGSTVATEEFTIPREADGHYYVDTEINGAHVRFVVDESMPQTVLSPEDARAARLDENGFKFSDRVVTPSGETPVASFTVRELRFKTLTLFDVKLGVADRPLETSIAGTSFLKRFSSYEFRADKLVLRQ